MSSSSFLETPFLRPMEHPCKTIDEESAQKIARETAGHTDYAKAK
jgi:hypothetical protein